MAKAKNKGRTAEDLGVTENYESKSTEEVIADGDHIDHDLLEEAGVASDAAGAPFRSPILSAPSDRNNPYLPEDLQHMEMQPVVMGPPPFGSPDPVTSAGRLLPIEDHPLAAEHLPEGHSAAISEDYGKNVLGLTHPAQSTSHPITPDASDYEIDAAGGREAREAQGDVDATDGARELASENGVDLREVEGTGADGRVTKGDVENHLSDDNDDS
jgi:pyruvate/2-oxoglutarate dehydrogenase complex dihydrolipoamide acyltransferase (E2) component